MSRTHSKFKSQPSAVGHITLRPRSARHGKPLGDVFFTKEVVKVTQGTRVNPQTGEVEAYSERKVLSARRPMNPIEIEVARKNVLRALNPTTKHARPNGESTKKGK